MNVATCSQGSDLAGHFVSVLLSTNACLINTWCLWWVCSVCLWWVCSVCLWWVCSVCLWWVFSVCFFSKAPQNVKFQRVDTSFIFTLILSKYILELCFICAFLCSCLVLSGLPTKIYFLLYDARQVTCPASILHSKCM